MVELPVITNEDLRKVASKLTTYAPSWAKEMAIRMSLDKDWKSKVGKKARTQVVYNIAYGSVKCQFRRRMFLKYAKELLIEAGNAIEEIVS